MPHVKPASFIFQVNSFYIATNYTTKAYKNIKANPHVAITVDNYNSGKHRALLAHGGVKIIEDCPEFEKI